MTYQAQRSGSFVRCFVAAVLVLGGCSSSGSGLPVTDGPVFGGDAAAGGRAGDGGGFGGSTADARDIGASPDTVGPVADVPPGDAPPTDAAPSDAVAGSDTGIDGTVADGPAPDAPPGATDGGSTADGPGCTEGAACATAGGGTGLCKAGACAACADPADDAACVAAYGANHLCIAGSCAAGECRTSQGCAAGQLCDAARTCGPCTSDAQCTGDARYGAGTICVQGACVPGNCHGTSAECTGASAMKICGAQTPNTCGNCTSDQQCQSDAAYGAGAICNVTSGQCVANTCATAGAACPINPGDVCCNVSGNNQCVPGNCCDNTQCGGLGGVCVNNICSSCYQVEGHQYFVDPVAGNDQTANGSGVLQGAGGAKGGASAGCRFKTITRALQIIGSSPPPGTRITVVSSGPATVLDVAETWPIIVPANVTISTSSGPIRANVPAGRIGFRLTGDGAALTPDPAGPLTIDGAAASGNGVVFAVAGSGTATLAHVTVQNTLDHGLLVSSGVAAIGAGVTVQNAGTDAARRTGLVVLGGQANIVVPAGGAPTSFKNNTQHGILVTQSGVLNVTGAPAFTGSPALPTGAGTVVASGNQAANLLFTQQPNQVATPSVIDGLVSWASLRGLRITGGSRIKVRNGVFLANADVGIRVDSANATAAGNNLANIDLGSMADPGRNHIQAALGSNPNLNAGLCVQMNALASGQTLQAAGNVFAGPKDCGGASAGALTHNASQTCVGRVDIGVRPLTVSANVTSCTIP